MQNSQTLQTTPIRWGVLGVANIGVKHVIPAILASASEQLVAVASRNILRAQEKFAHLPNLRLYGDYDSLLNDPEIDAIYSPLPNHLHAEWTIKALEAGKHVLCEKPLACTVAQVDAVADASARAGRIAVEAFMYLHHPQILRAIGLAQQGALGRLELVNSTFSFFLTYPGDPRVDPAMGGGSLWDVGCYPVSLARRIAGEEPDRIGAFARFDERGVDRTFIGQLHFPGGLLAQFDCGFAAPDRERVEIVGSDATLVLESPFLPAPDGPPPVVTMRRGRDETPVDVPSTDQYHAEVDDLTAAILDGTPPRIGLAFSRGNIATLVELDQTARVNAGLIGG